MSVHAAVSISIADGTFSLIPCEFVRGLAVHESIARGWSVTHPATGMLISDDLVTGEQAHSCANAVADAFDAHGVSIDAIKCKADAKTLPVALRASIQSLKDAYAIQSNELRLAEEEAERLRQKPVRDRLWKRLRELVSADEAPDHIDFYDLEEACFLLDISAAEDLAEQEPST